MRKFICFILFAAVFSCAGEFADKQVKKFVDFTKKGQYEKAVSVFLDNHALFLNDSLSKKQNVVAHAGVVKKFITQHGKIVNYTKWRTRTLSKDMTETVYQINCQYSAWMVEVIEYLPPKGKPVFNSVRYVSEEDIFKIYGR